MNFLALEIDRQTSAVAQPHSDRTHTDAHFGLSLVTLVTVYQRIRHRFLLHLLVFLLLHLNNHIRSTSTLCSAKDNYDCAIVALPLLHSPSFAVSASLCFAADPQLDVREPDPAFILCKTSAPRITPFHSFVIVSSAHLSSSSSPSLCLRLPHFGPTRHLGYSPSPTLPRLRLAVFASLHHLRHFLHCCTSPLPLRRSSRPSSLAQLQPASLLSHVDPFVVTAELATCPKLGSASSASIPDWKQYQLTALPCTCCCTLAAAAELETPSHFLACP